MNKSSILVWLNSRLNPAAYDLGGGREFGRPDSIHASPRISVGMDILARPWDSRRTNYYENCKNVELVLDVVLIQSVGLL